MGYRGIRALVGASALAAVCFAVPAEGKACGLFDCLFGWCGGGASQTTYRVPYVAAYAPPCAPACPTPCPTPCAAPCVTQTCQYVPQTYYRPVCQHVPVTSYLPVVVSDPCTGCAVTSYRPITTWGMQTQLVAYTTYRIVCSPVCAPAAPCSPCASGIPTATYGEPAPAITEAPAAPLLPGPEPMTSAPTFNGGQTPSTFGGAQAPGTESVQAPSTFESQRPATDGAKAVPAPDANKVEPIPDKNSDTAPAGPRLSPLGRETSLPVRSAAHFELISSRAIAPSAQTAAALGVWRASHD